MTYYSTQKVISIIREYRTNINIINEYHKPMASVGVGQYGAESTLPRGNKISNVTEKEALRQWENKKKNAEKLTDIKYLQDRWHRVKDEKEAMALNMCLDGYRISSVAENMRMDRTSVYNILERVAERINNPQCTSTESTEPTEIHN